MVAEMDTDLKKGRDTVALYLTIPRYIVMDEGFPFNRDAEIQTVTVKIDYEANTLIIKKKNGS